MNRIFGNASRSYSVNTSLTRDVKRAIPALYWATLIPMILLSGCGGNPENPDVTAEEFAACRTDDTYDHKCLGETTTLTAIVEHHSGDGVHMSVRATCDSEDSPFSVDAVNLDSKYAKDNKDKCVKVFAKIGPENTIYPDITVKETIWIETKQQFEARKDNERFIEGGWESKEEYENAKKEGYEDRRDAWLALKKEQRAKQLADAEWQQLQAWPEKLSGFSLNPGRGETCETLLKSSYSEYKGRHTRTAYPHIYDPSTRTRYYFMLNEEIDQRDVYVERLWPIWKSKKSPDHYLVYSKANRFGSFKLGQDGIFRDAELQRDGGKFDSLEDTVAIMNKVRPNIEPDEYRRYGILPDESEGQEIQKCERSTYQTIEELPFLVRENLQEKGIVGKPYLTIKEVLRAE
jgi:hypothetical protein